MAAGRPAKLDDVILLPDGKDPPGKTPRIRWEVIIERIRSGIPIETACLSTGVNPSTYYRWVEKGEDRWIDGHLRRATPQYRQFREAATRARAEAESIAVAHVLGAASSDWRAAAFYLERSHAERWRKRDTVYQAGPADGDPEIPDRRVVHDIDPSAAGKLGELLEIVERASRPRDQGEEPRAEGGDGSTP